MSSLTTEQRRRLDCAKSSLFRYQIFNCRLYGTAGLDSVLFGVGKSELDTETKAHINPGYYFRFSFGYSRGNLGTTVSYSSSSDAILLSYIIKNTND